MAEGFCSPGRRDFWTEMKKIRGGKGSLPTCVDDATGENEIAHLFSEKYKELYTSVPYNHSDLVELITDLQGTQQEHLAAHNGCHAVGMSDVEGIIRKLKSGKSDDNGSMYTNHIIHGSRKLFLYLALLFSCMLKHCCVPHAFTVSTLIPIPKNKKKSLNDASNYRAIALSNILGKVLDHILLVKCRHVFTSSDHQFGFKAKHSTSMCSFVLQETAQYYLNHDSDVYCTLLDASKAFDRVEYVKLFRSLVAKSICPVICLFLVKLYTSQNVRVKWGQVLSHSSRVMNGVKQGGVLSPLMFSVYIDNLLTFLSNARVGCYLGDAFCGALGYADDVVLLAPTLSALHAMLRKCEVFGHDYNVLFNSSKSKAIVMKSNPHTCSPDPVINFMNGRIEVVKYDRHLGHLTGNISQDDIITSVINDFQRRVNMVRMHFKNLPSNVMYSIFKMYCMPLYGSQLFNLDCRGIQRFYVAWRKAVRYCLNLPYRCHSRLLHLICEDVPIDIQLYRRFSNFFLSLSRSRNALVKAAFRLILEGSGTAISETLTVVAAYRRIRRHEFHTHSPSFDQPPTHDVDAAIALAVRELLEEKRACTLGDEGLFSLEECDIALYSLCVL